jgi:Polyketide cyclase / dehydrase and lipid transport
MPLPGPIAVFHSAAKSMGRAAEMRIDLTGYDRPAWLAERSPMRQADIDGTLTFEPVPDGTRMHWSWHVRPKGPSKLLAPVINWISKRQERTVWAAMKRYLEAPQPKRVTATLAPFGVGFPRQPARRASSWPTAAG